jgi:hypothetical protein
MDMGRVAALFQVLQEARDRRRVGRQAVLDHQAAGGLQDPRRLFHEACHVVEVVGGDAAGDQVEGGRRKGQGVHVADQIGEVRQAHFGGAVASHRYHAGGNVEADHKVRAGRQARGGMSGAGGDIQAALARCGRREVQYQVQVVALGVGRAGGVGLGLARKLIGCGAGRVAHVSSASQGRARRRLRSTAK